MPPTPPSRASCRRSASTDTLVVCGPPPALVRCPPGGGPLRQHPRAHPADAHGPARHLDERLHERHGPFLRLQLDHRQLLLRRNQHGLHQPSSGRALDLPRLRRDDGLPRLRRPRSASSGTSPTSFMALMAIVNLVAIAILGKYAFIAPRRLRQPEEARHPQPGIRSERHAEPPRHPSAGRATRKRRSNSADAGLIDPVPTL